MRRWRGRLLALAIGYLVVELVVMPVAALRAPLRVRTRFPTPLYVLGQHTKDGLAPDDYVLVLGDSYAEGHGDWLLDAMREGGDPPFQATHVLHERTGRDVLSFGRGGASSVSGWVFLAEKRFAALRRAGVGEPSQVLLYFYEGNDLDDNLADARAHLDLKGRALPTVTDDELDAWVADRARAGALKGLPGNLYAPYLLLDLVKGRASVDARPPSCTVRAPDDAHAPHNAVRAGAAVHVLDGPSEGPGVWMTPRQLDFSLRVVERALDRAVERFADAEVTLVYVPSPLACYELASEQVAVKHPSDEETLRPAADVRARSDEVRARVAALAAAAGVGFLDATDPLRAAGRETLLHGPVDGDHFNRAGYERLGGFLAEHLGPATDAD